MKLWAQSCPSTCFSISSFVAAPGNPIHIAITCSVLETADQRILGTWLSGLCNFVGHSWRICFESRTCVRLQTKISTFWSGCVLCFQLLLQLVLDILHYPGIPGLFIASVFCSSLRQAMNNPDFFGFARRFLDAEQVGFFILCWWKFLQSFDWTNRT